MKCYLVDFVGYEDDIFGFQRYYLFSSYEAAKHCILYIYHHCMIYDPKFAEYWESEEEVNERFEECCGIFEFAYIHTLNMNPVYKPNNF